MLPDIISAGSEMLISFMDGMTEMLPDIVSTISEIVNTIVGGLSDSDTLSKIIDSAVTLITTLVVSLTEPDLLINLVDASIELIFALADGLIQALPILLERLPEIVDNIVNSLVEIAPKLIMSGLELILNLRNGILDNKEEIYNAIVQVVSRLLVGIIEFHKNLKEQGNKLGDKIFEGIKEKLSSAYEIGKNLVGEIKKGVVEIALQAGVWGKDIIDNFIGGIKEKWENLKETVSDIAQGIKDFLGFSEPKEGPLSNFHTYAPDMMDLYAQGIKDNTKKVTSQLESSMSEVKGTLEVDGVDSIAPDMKNAFNLNNPQTNSGAFYGGSVVYNINIESGTISNDYDARRAGKMISESLAELRTMENLSRGV